MVSVDAQDPGLSVSIATLSLWLCVNQKSHLPQVITAVPVTFSNLFQTTDPTEADSQEQKTRAV